LQEAGIRIIQMEGLIEEGLEAAYGGTEVPAPMRRSFGGCAKGDGCGGDGTGCG
jgi:nitrogen fixation protein NifB